MNLIDKKIAFLGDSITEGVGVSKIENVFWKRVAERTGAKAYGYGVGGTRIAPQHNPDSNAIMGQFFGSRVTGMIPDAEVVVVFGGTNDFGHGDAPFGDVSSRDETTFCGALHKLIRDLIERYPQAQLVLMTPLHRSGENELGYNEFGVRRDHRLEDYVNAIQTIAGYYGIPVLDLFRTSGLQPAVSILKERYMSDGLHPNDAGHERIADKLIGFLTML